MVLYTVLLYFLDRLLSSLEAADLLQNFSLDSQAKEGKISEPAKKVNLLFHFHL